MREQCSGCQEALHQAVLYWWTEGIQENGDTRLDSMENVFNS